MHGRYMQILSDQRRKRNLRHRRDCITVARATLSWQHQRQIESLMLPRCISSPLCHREGVSLTAMIDIESSVPLWRSLSCCHITYGVFLAAVIVTTGPSMIESAAVIELFLLLRRSLSWHRLSRVIPRPPFQDRLCHHGIVSLAAMVPSLVPP